MLKYTVINEGKFLTFTGIEGTEYEDVVSSHQKTLIKEVIEDVPKSALLLIDTDDVSSEYKFFEVTNPTTGVAFSSLAEFRLYVMTALNSDDVDSNLFIDNWDAIANDPVLADGGLYDSTGDLNPDATAPNAFYFIVTVADAVPSNNTTLDGENGWNVGDIVKSTGTKWVRQPRVIQVAAFNTSYVNTVGAADPNWNTIENAQLALDELYIRVANFNGSLASLTDTDFTTIAPVADDVLTYDGSKWVPRVVSGRTLIKVLERADGTTAAPTAAGNYLLITGDSAGWVPGAADVGDVLNWNTTTWTVVTDASDTLPGAVEIMFTLAPNENSNYVWDGAAWQEFDAYEPNSGLDSVTVSNPNLGDVSTPPYGAAPFTGASIRGRSTSKILDDILFQTVPHTYVAPTAATTSSGTQFNNLERGTELTGDLTGSYTKIIF